MGFGFLKEEFENMKLKQKEIFIEKKHQELDLKEEKSIKELDQLSQKERSLCQILTAIEMNIITGEFTTNFRIYINRSFHLDESLVKRIERLRDYLNMLEEIKVYISEE
jgi:hypothetical protein